MFRSKIALFVKITYLSKFKSKNMEAPKNLNFNSFTTSVGNQIWAPAMQLAWNELREKFAKGEPIVLETEDQKALQIIKNFNQATFQTKDINPDSIYVKSGYGQSTLKQINEEVLKKFPQKDLPPIDIPLSDSDIICYAYLFKQILFSTKFDRRQGGGFRFRGKNVDSFYASNESQKKQVLVHNYTNQDQFMVQIKGKDGKDSLFLIKNSGVNTIEEAIKLTNEGTNKYPQKLGKTDIFQMPIVSLDYKRDFKELINLHFKNKQLAEYYIRVMFEAIKLNIDESGAKVQNQAVIIASRCMPLDQKQIVLDKSFWIVMKESDRPAYLCAFINEPKQTVK